MERTATKPTIRRAVASDCPQMLTLIEELARFEKAPNAVTVTMEEFVAGVFGDHLVWGACVAEVREGIVGTAIVYVRYSTWKGRRLYLQDLVVTETMRGQVIGK